MCGIAGIVSLNNEKIHDLDRKLEAMGKLIAHRGPDDNNIWQNKNGTVGFAHRRLSIIDLSAQAAQPMIADNGSVITYNGEVYNYPELMEEMSGAWSFGSVSDTETILAAYQQFGHDCVDHLRGMFAFAIWDERKNEVFCARDRFGIKPFYYTVQKNNLYFASEIKALLPFLDSIETDKEAFSEYITFQYTISRKTLFKEIEQLLPGENMSIKGGKATVSRYWDVSYEIDYLHTEKYFEEHLRELVDESVQLHLRSDVPVGSYLSGGIDSSLISILSRQQSPENRHAFHGKFTCFEGYDESAYAREVAKMCDSTLHEIDITADDFASNIKSTIYHLDVPVAGPGSFPQFMVSKLASEKVKVVLGGQGGDEIFGGYARYVIAYFEQAIKAAIDGTYRNGNFVVTPESIIPNLGVLREYKPLIKEFWRDGLFGSLDERYFRLVNRATDMREEVNWSELDLDAVYEKFQGIFNNARNVRKEAYFDSMTHFDFKCLLPALLQVEDRMSMAHGLESRVPFLDHRIVEFAATIPADVKFKDGQMKHLIKNCFSDVLPESLLKRRDKMGFPVPLKEWFNGDLRDTICDIFADGKTRQRELVNYDAVMQSFEEGSRFSRKTWALLSLELWHQQFHDRASDFRKLIN